MGKGVAMIQSQCNRSDKPSEIEGFAAASANRMNMGQEEGCSVDFLICKRAVHEEQLFGVKLMVTIPCENGVAQNAMEVANGGVMDLCGIEVIVGVSTVVGQAMP